MKKNVNLIILLCLVISLAGIALFPIDVVGQVDPFSEIQLKLLNISEDEIEIIHNLFVLANEIEEMEKQEVEIAREIDGINTEMLILEKNIKKEEIKYTKSKDALEQVLKTYQRMGPGSYLEIILNSDSLTTFLRRINTLRDLTRNTGDLMEQLEESRDKLTAENQKLTEKLNLIEEKHQLLRESLAKSLSLKEEMEHYLFSLEEDREYYQEQLENMQIMWTELKPLFSETIKEFTRIIKEGNFPDDAIKISITLFGIRGSLEDKVFNSIVAEQSILPRMELNFYQDKVELRMPDNHLILIGTFVIKEGSILTLKVEEGSFFNMPLQAGAIDELFSEEELQLDFKPLLEGNTIRSVEITEGYLRLLFLPSFF
ncbi:coiled-coil domain-containing protein [Alkaliphilus peptidifermentans]|uniref:N-terminal domain of peptidoglycan hydrolase CwlO-containing protein n=1 Tax=Alkaliphilus peptidifermentans DSM 18978 TaxID=1120976 RepID=A0A1G5JTM7_9FIRM|nr:hypothetical protein [Alkaliphilus peptidifermentans]SCY91220.1 N-terminal domain of peptidoglycan hydrolase CwlO-containing protein [Alkaliphilus peptidifermentans DSM 18978]